MKKDPGAETNVFRQEWTQKLESRGQFEVVQAGFKIMRGRKMVMGSLIFGHLNSFETWNLQPGKTLKFSSNYSLGYLWKIILSALRPWKREEPEELSFPIYVSSSRFGGGATGQAVQHPTRSWRSSFELCVCVSKRESERSRHESIETLHLHHLPERSPATHWQATCVDMNQSSNSMVISEAQWGNTNIRLLFS